MVRLRPGWLITSLLLLAPTPSAEAARLEVALVSRSAEPPSEVELTVRGPSGTASLRRVVQAGSRPPVFEVGEGSWTVEARAAGMWAAPRSASLAQDGTGRVEVEIYNAAVARGRVEVERGEALPAELGFELYPPIREAGPGNPRPRRDPHKDAIAFRCPVVEGTFDCPVPAGEWDVRLRAANHISQYFWKFRFTREPAASFGTLRLRRGASVVGWVVAEGTVPKGSSCQLTLVPLQIAPSQGAETIARALSLTTSADERGFFHFEGVPPGAYTLSAALQGFAAARFAPLQVLENRESQLAAPLVLRSPLQLEVRVNPATDPRQRPWRVELSRAGDTLGTAEEIATGSAGPDGIWRTTNLSPGRFLVDLVDADGSPWDSRSVDLADGSNQVDFDLDLIEVEGTLRLAGEPLAATLHFGRKTGLPRFTFQSDEEGRFAGLVTREGSWKVQVDARTPRVQRTLTTVVRRSPGKRAAKVTLDLPGGLLRGRVTDERDKPVADALVQFSMGGEPLEIVRSGKEGEFEAHGLGSGLVFVQASHQDLESPGLWLPLDEVTTPEPLHLVLRKKREVTGWVLSPALEGIPGTQVLARAPGELIYAQAVTDLSGKFSLKLPAAAASAEIVALPPGYGLQAHAMALDQAEDLRLVVEPRGGTLILSGVNDVLNPPDEAPASELVFVTQNGVPLLLDLLRNWALVNGFQAAAQGLRSFPHLAAGQYQVCRVPFDRMPAWLQGNRGAARCVTGNLSAGGELALAVPAR